MPMMPRRLRLRRRQSKSMMSKRPTKKRLRRRMTEVETEDVMGEVDKKEEGRDSKGRSLRTLRIWPKRRMSDAEMVAGVVE